jgi:aldehyde dehydrogenase (NAD+)
MLANLRSWMSPESVPPSSLLLPCTAEIRREPFGVVLIVGPVSYSSVPRIATPDLLLAHSPPLEQFNYPWMLVLKPLLGALAGGNCAVIKPSELSPATAASMKRLLPQYLDASAVRCHPPSHSARLARREGRPCVRSRASDTHARPSAPPPAPSVVDGGIPATQALLRERFDFIFFTGSERVGRIIARAAVAPHSPPATAARPAAPLSAKAGRWST